MYKATRMERIGTQRRQMLKALMIQPLPKEISVKEHFDFEFSGTPTFICSEKLRNHDVKSRVVVLK